MVCLLSLMLFFVEHGETIVALSALVVCPDQSDLLFNYCFIRNSVCIIDLCNRTLSFHISTFFLRKLDTS